jgi:hypothetical protein
MCRQLQRAAYTHDQCHAMPCVQITSAGSSTMVAPKCPIQHTTSAAQPHAALTTWHMHTQAVLKNVPEVPAAHDRSFAPNQNQLLLSMHAARQALLETNPCQH